MRRFWLPATVAVLCLMGTAPLFGQIPLPPDAVPPPPFDGPYPLDNFGLVPPDQKLGLYGELAVTYLKPHFKGRFNSGFPVDPQIGANVFLPEGRQDWTGSPRVTLGYRLGEGVGDLRFSYQLVSSTGDTNLGIYDSEPGRLRSRLNLSIVDFEYVTAEFLSPENTDTSPWFRRELRAGIGTRAISGFFDSVAHGQDILESRASDRFYGLGLRLTLDYRQQIADKPLWLYSTVNPSGILVRNRERFSQTVNNPGGAPIVNGISGKQNMNGIGDLGSEVGLSWARPFGLRNSRLNLGYSWERFWDFARTDNSKSELTLQGIVFRAEFHY